MHCSFRSSWLHSRNIKDRLYEDWRLGYTGYYWETFSDEKSQWRGPIIQLFRLAYVSWKPYFQCGLWARNFNNTQQDAPKSSNIWTGGCYVDTYIWHFWETVPSENKEVIRLDNCEMTMQLTEIRWHFPNLQPMKFKCSKLFNLKTDVGTSNQRFKTINQKVEYQQFDWRKRALKDNWRVYRSGCPYDFQHFYLLQATSKVRKGSD